MALELNLFGASIDFGSFDFFDLMDAEPAQKVAPATILAFEAKPAQAQAGFVDSSVKTAA